MSLVTVHRQFVFNYPKTSGVVHKADLKTMESKLELEYSAFFHYNQAILLNYY